MVLHTKLLRVRHLASSPPASRRCVRRCWHRAASGRGPVQAIQGHAISTTEAIREFTRPRTTGTQG